MEFQTNFQKALVVIEELFLKFLWKCKGSINAKTTLKCLFEKLEELYYMTSRCIIKQQ